VLEKVYNFALAGKPWAVEFIADRTEGKARQHIEIEADLPTIRGVEFD